MVWSNQLMSLRAVLRTRMAECGCRTTVITLVESMTAESFNDLSREAEKGVYFVCPQYRRVQEPSSMRRTSPGR
ncbi:hypothetical protein GCM10009838_09880 [Catenulispora subtropica]|uniref:Uncharacterized protein n=1 Tax=Catenulispora subtropica TaxID=450798 RepID=A0ABN2QR00_9ACTN